MQLFSSIKLKACTTSRAVGKWAQAQSLDGPWAVTAQPPANLNAILATLTKGGQVHSLDNPRLYVTQSATNGSFPDDLRQHGAGAAHHDPRDSLV